MNADLIVGDRLRRLEFRLGGKVQLCGIEEDRFLTPRQPSIDPSGMGKGHHTSGYDRERAKKRRIVSLVENKAVIRRLVEEVYNEGNLDIVDELMAPDVFDHAAVRDH